MKDMVSNQLSLGKPDLSADHPKIGKPQFATLSIAGNDLGFGDIVNGCLYHWTGWKPCTPLLQAAHAKLDLTKNKAFLFEIAEALAAIMAKGRAANPIFQLYVSGYVEFWNADNTQCDAVTWSPWYREKAYLTTTLRKDMNSLVTKLNNVISQAVGNMKSFDEAIYYVDGWQSQFDGHRFCEQEDNPEYHTSPVADKTWFIHYETEYKDLSASAGFPENSSWFDVVDGLLIPPKDGKSTTDQIDAVGGNVSMINPAYDDVDSMTAALNKLAADDSTLGWVPITWLRMMHPKGFGYTAMSDAFLDDIIRFGATGAASAPTTLERTCGFANNKFMSRDDMNHQIGVFCADAAKQGVQDSGSGSTVRTYNLGSRYQVDLSMDWPSGLDITKNMEANCTSYMAQIMDGKITLSPLPLPNISLTKSAGCDGNDPQNPLNWKHGGTFQVDQVRYNIVPQVDQGYTPGTCSFHLQEDESWSGVDGPGTERHWSYHIEKDTMKDGARNMIATLGFDKSGAHGVEVSAGDSNPLKFNTSLPNPLVITPEAGGNPRDYIQFNFGKQAWTTTQSSGAQYCNTGEWSSDYSPANRNMDCFFQC